jgi:diguanylate cyclase (GGDEF)-like protein
LKLVGESIQANIRSSDICARVGGDEFLILAETAEIEAMEKVCARIEAEFKTLLHDNMPENMGLSYGVVIVSDFDQSLEYWLKQADQKMYQLKQKRRQQL